MRQGSIASGLMFTIEDMEGLRVVVSFREFDIGKTYEGMEVGITADGTGDVQHTGIISRISPLPSHIRKSQNLRQKY